MTRPRKILIGAASSGALLMLAACGSSSSSTVTVTTTASARSSASTSASSSPAAPTPTATQGSGGQSLPAAPAGAKELQTEKEFGGVYARYEISGKTPADVEADYKATLEKDGYKVTSSGGGGGGWGKWGGAGAGLTADKTGSYASVQAGGQKSGPTYFEVCVGPTKEIEKACENVSDGPDSTTKKS